MKYGRKYWHYFMRMDKHPKGWLHLYEPSLGMICLEGKVMVQGVKMTCIDQACQLRCQVGLVSLLVYDAFLPTPCALLSLGLVDGT